MKASLPTKKIGMCSGVFLYFHGFIFFPFPLNDGIMTLYSQIWEWRERIEGK